MILRVRTICMLVSIALMCAGCSAGAPQEQGLQTLVLWTSFAGEQKEAVQELVDEYNRTVARDEGFVLEVFFKPDYDALRKQLTASASNEPGAGDLPNMAMLGTETAYELAGKKLLVNYADYISRDSLDEFVPGFLAEGDLHKDGRTFLLPVVKTTEVLVVNKTDFDQFCRDAALDDSLEPVSMDDLSSWEGLLKAADTYYKWTLDNNPSPSGKGRALFGLDSVGNYLYTAHEQLGREIVYAAGKGGVVDFGTGVFEKVWDTLYRPFLQGHFAEYGRLRSDDFKTGDILMYLGPTTDGARLSNRVVGEDGQKRAIDLQVFPAPVFAGGQPVVTQQGTGIVTMKSDARQEAACARFVDWLTQEERNVAFAARLSSLPVRERGVGRMLEEYALKGHDAEVAAKMLTVSLEQIESGYHLYTPPVFWGCQDVRSVLSGQLHGILTESADEAGYVAENLMTYDTMEQYILHCETQLSTSPYELTILQ